MLQTRPCRSIAISLFRPTPILACAPETRHGNGDEDAGNGPPGSGPDAAVPVDFTDFPADPIIDPGAPANAPDLFQPPAVTTGGPCVLEPEERTLLPRQWLRPRVSFVPAGTQNLFEIRMHAEHQLNDLRVYTRSTTWVMPELMWESLNMHFTRHRITVTVTGLTFNNNTVSGVPASSLGSFEIAPVPASGSIVYWTTGAAGGTSAFKGFRVGEDVVHEILSAPQADQATCVGCHSSTPDGEFVAFSATPPEGGDGSNTHIDLRSVDAQAQKPSYITPAAANLLGRVDQQQPVFSIAHWKDGDRVALSMWNDWPTGTDIIWTDLTATSTARGVGWDYIARTGDSQRAAAVAWSRSGTLIAYTSADSVGSGMNFGNGGDIWLVPYNDHRGGMATPVPGASDPNVTEHYASFSADDNLLAFTRVADSNSAYDQQGAETYVIPTQGGTAQRLAANDPPACTGQASPGVTNSWPKWSPEVQGDGDKRYYWLTFSSKRDNGTPQLYIAPVTVDELGSVTSYPAVYLWNQPANESNHTPAWDYFGIVIE